MQTNQSELEKIALRKRPSSSGTMWRLLMFSFVIFFGVIASYVGIEFGYKNFLENQKDKASNEASSLITGVSKEQQMAVVNFYSRLSNMKGLLDNHLYFSNFLDFLENKTSPNVYLEDVSFFVKENKVKANGVARTFLDLSRQMEGWSKAEGVSEVVLDSSKSIGGGRVSFTALFNFSEKVLSKQTQNSQ